MLPIEVDLDNISINIKTLSAIEHMISDIKYDYGFRLEREFEVLFSFSTWRTGLII